MGIVVGSTNSIMLSNTTDGNSSIIGVKGKLIDGTITSATGPPPAEASGDITITGAGSANNTVILGGDRNLAFNDDSVVMGYLYQTHEDNSRNIGGSCFLRDVPKIIL